MCDFRADLGDAAARLFPGSGARRGEAPVIGSTASSHGLGGGASDSATLDYHFGVDDTGARDKRDDVVQPLGDEPEAIEAPKLETTKGRSVFPAADFAASSESPAPRDRSFVRDAILVVLGGVLGLAASGITTWQGAIISRDSDKAAFLREERLAAYGDFLADVDKLQEANVFFVNAYRSDAPDGTRTAPPSPPEAEMQSVRTSLGRVQLVGSGAAAQAGAKAISNYSKYMEFVLWQYESRSDSYRPVDWTLLDSAADYMTLVNACLATEAKGSFLDVVRQDLGVDSEEARPAPDCDKLDWQDLRATYDPWAGLKPKE